MKRYATQDWKDLTEIQNEHYENVDILSITGFMNDTQFAAHVADYKERTKNK